SISDTVRALFPWPSVSRRRASPCQCIRSWQTLRSTTSWRPLVTSSATRDLAHGARRNAASANGLVLVAGTRHSNDLSLSRQRGLWLAQALPRTSLDRPLDLPTYVPHLFHRI